MAAESRQISIEQARRIAVRAQILDGSAGNVLDTVRRIGYLQLDPTNRVAKSHLLVLWSRLGAYDPAELDRLLWEERSLFEWRAFIYPIEHLPAFRSLMRRYPEGDSGTADLIRRWVQENDSFRQYVLSELDRRGPLRSRDLEDRSVMPWPSTGWSNNRNVSQMLQILGRRGEVAIVGRQGAERVWDRAERWYPEGDTLSDDEADRVMAGWTLRALGIARRGPGTPVSIEGVAGEWVVDPMYLDAIDVPVPDRITLLSPFDRLIYDRERTVEIFGFRYRLEMYIPKAEREYGYFVLPVLRGDRLVGRVDPELDRKKHVLRVHAVYMEPGAPEGTAEMLDGALRDLARWLGASDVIYDEPEASAGLVTGQ
jgi:uncharacterized protein YcaQ